MQRGMHFETPESDGKRESLKRKQNERDAGDTKDICGSTERLAEK